MSKVIDLERTFLVRYVPAQIEGATSELIEDTYIPEDADQAHFRLRAKGSRYEMTKKFAVDAEDFSKLEDVTIELSSGEFAAFKALSNKSVRKRRFYCTVYGHKAEVDVFLDALDGLMIIDFPFVTEEEMKAFVVPEVCLVEITQKPIASGGYVAGKTYAEIQYELEQLEYAPQFLEKEY